MNFDVIEQLKSGRKVVLYGASSAGARVFYNLTGIGVDPESLYFYDSNTSKHGGVLLGRPILSSAEYEALPKDTLILISSVMYYEIAPMLEKQGFTNVYYEHDLIFSRKQFEKFDERFRRLIDSIPDRRMNDDEFYTLYRSALSLESIPGAFAEVGVYKGGSAYLLASVSDGKKLFLFDTFAGLPSHRGTKANHELIGREPSAGWLSNTDAESVRAFVLESGIMPEYLELRIGCFPDTATDLENQSFSLVHLDCDLYQSTIDALAFFYPRLSPGGRIITHDYNACGCPGVRKAFDDYFGPRGLSHLLVEISESQAMALKC